MSAIGKVVVYTPTDPAPVAARLAEGGADPVIARDAEELAQAMPGAVGLLIGMGQYRDAHPLLPDEGAGLRWVQLSASGYDLYETLGGPDWLHVMRAVGIWGQSVAGHALALTLALLRRLPDCFEGQAQGEWRRAALSTRIASLAGRRVLLMGYGDIGTTLAAALRALGAEVRVIASRAREVDEVTILGPEALDAELESAELVITAMPSASGTRGLFDAARLARMRPGALLVNVGRGEVLDEAALAEALNAGHLGGAGLDVFTTEPLPPGSPLWTARNCIVTPHTAAFGDRGSLDRLAALCLSNARAIAAGRAPVGQIGGPGMAG